MRTAPGRPPASQKARNGSIAGILAAALLLASCTLGPSMRPPLATSGAQPNPVPAPASSAASPMPIGPGGPGRSAPPITWGACDPGVAHTAGDGTSFTVQCGTVTAPIIYAQPHRGQLTLQVAEAHSEATLPDAQPLLVMLGDPGSRSYADIAEIAASLPQAIRQHFVIITADMRGTGDSTGVDCVSQPTTAAIIGMSSDPPTSEGGSQLAAISRQLTFDCGDFVGPALTTINSTNAADDLDTVRAALGAPALSVIATGGSATIGAVYADRYPGRVAAMVLSAPGDPLTTPLQHAAASADAAESLFDDFAAACAGFGSGCPLGADPRAATQALVDRLATSGTETGDWVMTGGSVLMALIDHLPDESSWPALADAIAALDAEQAEPLAELLTADTNTTGPALTARLSARILYTCNDNSTRLSPTSTAAAASSARASAPLFGPYAVEMASLCAAWPAPDQALGRLSADGAPPLLVLGATRNPVHPYAEAQAVAGQLMSAVLVSWQSGSNLPYPGTTCIDGIVDDYLLRGVVPDRGVLCPP